MSLFQEVTSPTPFGIYDDDSHFVEDANSMLLYVRRRLGDDVMSVELTNKQIWANFEEAVLEFSKHINTSQAKSYMNNLLGLDVGFNETYLKENDVYVGETEDGIKGELLYQDLTDPRFKIANYISINGIDVKATPLVDKNVGPHGAEQTFPRESLEYLVRRAEPYASEADVGGSSRSIRGFIELKQDRQDYNIYKDLRIPFNDKVLTLDKFDPTGPMDQLSLFNPLYKEQIAPNAVPTKIRLNEVYHFSPQAAYRFFDTTSAVNYLNNQFSFESFTPETVFYVLPVFEDLLRASQLDISNRVRRSNYSYKLQGDNLRIFPRPTQENPLNLFIRFSFPNNVLKPSLPYEDSSIKGVSNVSNVPFGNIPYKGINSLSRQWIRQFCLALCKETLGLIRSKFSTVPIPGSELTLNGADLLTQSQSEKDKLNESLKETLESLTYQKILETDAQQSESMLNILRRVPIPNGRAIIIG